MTEEEARKLILSYREESESEEGEYYRLNIKKYLGRGCFLCDMLDGKDNVVAKDVSYGAMVCSDGTKEVTMLPTRAEEER